MNFLLDTFSKDALEAHNKYRTMHQVPALKWSRKLAKEATVWAEKLAKENTLRNGDTDDGENLYGITGKPDLKGNEPVDKWYGEVTNYNFRRPGFQSDAGHFTQIVWKSTKELGIGKAKSPDGKVLVVARYSPPGNLGNRFEQNVFSKASGSPSQSSTTRVYKTQIDKQEAEPVRSERSFQSSRNNPQKDDDFFNDFSDMGIGQRGKDKAGKRTETVQYDNGQGTTVVTKTFTTDDGGVRTVRKEIHTTRNGSDEDFGSWRRNKWDDDDDDFFGKTDANANVRSRRDNKRGLSPSHARERSPKIDSPGGPRSSSSSDKSFKDQCLSSHNKYRSMHSAPSLKWSDEIARDAQRYAEKLARAGTLRHSRKSERDNMGENLAMFSGDYDDAGKRASDMWYEEVKDYNFSRMGYQGGSGHFTQLVWKGSKELGMGRAKTPDGRCTYVVGRYRPAGNIINYMNENVSRRC